MERACACGNVIRLMGGCVWQHIVEEHPRGTEPGNALFTRSAPRLLLPDRREMVVEGECGTVECARVETIRRPVGSEDADGISTQRVAEIGQTLRHRRTQKGLHVQAGRAERATER